MPAFTMSQLAAFVAVAEVGTIGAASREAASLAAGAVGGGHRRRAFAPDPAASSTEVQGVILTPTGELVFPRARLILHQASEVQADVMGEERGITGVVRLGCYPSPSPTFRMPGLCLSSTGMVLPTKRTK